MASVKDPQLKLAGQEVRRRVRHPLHTLTNYIRQYITLEAGAVAVLYLALCFWIGLLLDWGTFRLFGFDWIQELQGLEQPWTEVSVRRSLLIVFLAGLLGLVVYKLLFRLMREFNDRALALVLERRYPRQLGDRLITAVEMAGPNVADRYGYSQALIEHTIADAAERVEQVDVREAFNWRRLRRLWKLVAASTVGVYLVVAIIVNAIAIPTLSSYTPIDYFWQFNDVAAIWTERNLLLMDSYWPRRAHLELVRFQDTPSHPGEMRVGRDEHRPDVQVRAVGWVIADAHSRDGWRALLWKDIPQTVGAGLAGKGTIPEKWPGWALEAEDRGAWSGWDVDKIELQLQKQAVRERLRREHDAAHQALEEIFSKLYDLADSPSMSRTLRKLVIPESVEFAFRGKTTKILRQFPREEGNRYSIGLGELKESGRFRVRGEDFYTPTKTITLVPPPSLISLTVDKEEPAYIYYRLQGDQKPLKGLRQRFRNHAVSVTGEASNIQVPFGTDLKLTAKADRKLKGDVRMVAPAASEERGALLPNVEVQMEPDGRTFWADFKNIVRTIEFNFEFRDEDYVKGRRRVIIKPIDDRAPEVFHVELGDRFGPVVLRKPRYKADPSRSSRGTAAEGLLITPDAILPFRGTVRDDYGLTQVNWVHEVEQVAIELVGSMPGTKDKLPLLVLQGGAGVRRGSLITSGFQFLPGQPGMALYAPAYWTWIGRVIQADVEYGGKRSDQEERLPMERFARRLLERSDEELPLKAIEQTLHQKPPARGLLKEHQLKDEDGFDLRKYLPRLKGGKTEAQLHYQLRLAIEGIDNNVETGPSRGRNETPFTFLVVSESELLVQVGIEEEAIFERLEKAYQKLDKAKVSLAEQIAKLSQPDSELSLVAIRVDEIRKALSDTASVTREVHGDYNRILRELEVNRVNPTKLSLVENKILRPLDDIVNPNFGKFHTTEEAANELYRALELDQAKGDNRPIHTKNALLTRDELDSLLLKMREVLDGMFEGVTFNQLLDLIVAVERDQREAAQRLRIYHDEVLRRLLEDLTRPKSK